MATILMLFAAALLQSTVPAFGSMYAGKQYFDATRSEIVPATSAKCAPDDPPPSSGVVRVLPFSAQEAKGRAWPSDWFHVVVTRGDRTEPVIDIEAAYGTCEVYAVALDGDTEPEVIIESGYGRGTSAYHRTLEVFRRGRDGYDRIANLALSGYAMVDEGYPDGWERAYSFKKADRGLASIVLRLRLKPSRPVVADDEALDALHFPVREY